MAAQGFLNISGKYIIPYLIENIKREKKGRMESASVVINNILLQLSDVVSSEKIKEIQMVLYMNLCGYTFQKNEDETSLIENTDASYEAIKSWQQALYVEGIMKSTVGQYSRELKKLMLHCGIGPLEMREKHIRSYLAFGKLNKKWKDKTFNSKVRSIRSFFKWAYEEDIINTNPMKKIKETREEFRMGAVLTPEQREWMRCACRTERELALFDLLYSSGGRVSEIVQLNSSSIDFQRRRVIIYGKGRKEREIRFSPQAKVHIENYLNSRTDDNDALFVSQKAPHQRLTIAGIQNIIKRIQSRDERLRGLKISPHTFRRTCGTDMLDRGAPIEMIKEKLGHEKADTTLKCYAKISMENVRDAERRYGVAS